MNRRLFIGALASIVPACAIAVEKKPTHQFIDVPVGSLIVPVKTIKNRFGVRIPFNCVYFDPSGKIICPVVPKNETYCFIGSHRGSDPILKDVPLDMAQRGDIRTDVRMDIDVFGTLGSYSSVIFVATGDRIVSKYPTTLMVSTKNL